MYNSTMKRKEKSRILSYYPTPIAIGETPNLALQE